MPTDVLATYNGDLESSDPPPTFGGGYYSGRTDGSGWATAPYEGTYEACLFSEWRPFPGYLDAASSVFENIPVTAGRTGTPRVWVNQGRLDGGPLSALIEVKWKPSSSSSSAWTSLGTKSGDGVSDWEQWTLPSFVFTENLVDLFIGSKWDGHTVNHGLWFYDLAQLWESDVPIPNVSPIERAQLSMVQCLTDYLDTELGLMETEASDGLVLPRPTKYLRTWAEEETDRSIIEVVPTRARSDAAQASIEYSQGRLTTDVFLSVGAILRRDNLWDVPTYVTALNRFIAACIRVVAIKHQNLGDTTDRVMVAVPDGELEYTMDEKRDPGGRMLRRVTQIFRVRIQEVI